MVSDRLTLAHRLKQELLDCVLDAEGDLAIALESYTAQELKRLNTSAFKGSDRTDFILDQFLTHRNEDETNAIHHFLAQNPQLSLPEQNLIKSWHQHLLGLFRVEDMQPEVLSIMNWMTQKRYQIAYNPEALSPVLKRLKPKDIIQCRLLPIDEETWMFSGPVLHLGQLGDTKLAVAIGSFRQHHPDSLYADAPDLFEEAWQSVEMMHESFEEFFEHTSLTLSGEDLHRRLKDYQNFLTQKELDSKGLDGKQSLKEVAQEAGVSKDELSERMELLGIDSPKQQQKIEEQTLAQMVRPPLELPKHLRSASSVTLLTDARGGQVFLPRFSAVIKTLESFSDLEPESIQEQFQTELADLEMKPFVWRSLAKTHPQALEECLKITTGNSSFDLNTDLESLLLNYHDRLEPTLPETASVPLHLHELFERAMAQLKPAKKNKKKAKSKVKSGFA